MTGPPTFAWRNILFGRDQDDAWGLYRVHCTSYAGLPLSAKLDVLAEIAAFARAVEADFQLLRVTRAWSPDDYVEAAHATLDGEHGHVDLLDELLERHRVALTHGGNGGVSRP